METKVSETALEAVGLLHRAAPEAMVVLFGSHARGQADGEQCHGCYGGTYSTWYVAGCRS